MLDLQKLRYFVTVAETLNVSTAATRLHISQSPLSRQIQALEESTGLSLFSREGGRLILTPAGQRLVLEARALLAHADRVERALADEARGSGGTLRLGYVDGSVHAGVLQTAIRRFREAAPSVGLELSSLRSEAQHQALLDGALDLGFTYRAPGPAAADRLAHVLVAREALRLVVPRGVSVLEEGRLSPGRLSQLPFIGLPDRVSPRGREALLRACAAIGFAPDIRYEVADAAVALGLVDAGLAGALLQSSLVAQTAPGVSVHTLPDDPELFVEIHLVCRRPAPGALVERFLDAQAIGR